MTGLFIRIYLDEDMDVLLARLVRARGFEAVTTLEAGQVGASDAEQLAFATHQQRVIVTHNRVDFERLAQGYFTAGQTHAGIWIAARHPPYELARRALVLLNAVAADEMQDQVRYF